MSIHKAVSVLCCDLGITLLSLHTLVGCTCGNVHDATSSSRLHQLQMHDHVCGPRLHYVSVDH